MEALRIRVRSLLKSGQRTICAGLVISCLLGVLAVLIAMGRETPEYPPEFWIVAAADLFVLGSSVYLFGMYLRLRKSLEELEQYVALQNELKNKKQDL